MIVSMPLKRKLQSCVATVAALMIVAGCSALRIDVDVYKGPLANSEEVQVRQYSALAMAAKPLMVELRNRLEKSDSFDKFLTKPENSRYRDSWIPESKDSHSFRNSQARFVNGALSSYEDAGDPQTASAILKAKDAWIAFKRQFSIFEISNDIDRPLAAETSSRSCDDSPFCRGAKRQESHQLWMDFRNAYAQFLKGTAIAELKDIQLKIVDKDNAPIFVGQRFVSTLQYACNQLQQSIISSDASRRDKRFAEAFCSSGQSANEKFAGIGRREAIEVHSQILFGYKNERFISRVLQISGAYLESRAQLRKLWLASVDIVDALSDGRGETQGRSGALAAVANLLANITQPRSLACALSSSVGNALVKPDALRAELKAGDSGLLDPGREVKWSDWTDPERQYKQYDRANMAIEAATKAFPREMAQMLRAADGRFSTPIDLQQGECTAVSANDRKELKDGQARRYGLVRGPTLDPSAGFDRVIAALDSALTDIQRGTAAGFERARLTKGIETLSKNFFDTLSAEGHDHNQERVRNAREDLDEALILFAERILFVTNNRSLIEEVKSDANLARATAVLQTVGNSLIVHANDLRERGAHGRRLMRRADSERAAVNLAFDLAPTQTLENVAREIRANLERLALDQERLNLEKSRRTRAGGLDAEALMALQDQVKTAAAEVEKARSVKDAAAEKVRLAYYTLALVDPKLTKPAEFLFLPSVVADRASLAKQLEKVGATATPKGLLDSMRDWINTNIIKVGVPESALNQLFAAKAYLNANDAALSAQDPNKKNLKPNVVFTKKIGDDYSEKLKKFNAERAALLQVESNSAAIKKQADLAALRSPASVGAATADAEIGVNDLRGALEIIRSVQESVLERAKQGKISEPAAVLELFKTEVGTRIETKSAVASDVKKYSALQKAIANTSPPPSFSTQSLGSGSATAKPGAVNQRDVLDDVIAALRQQRVQATAASDSGRAASVEKALALAYEQRAGLAYIRPASAYLRSAYTATALQSGSDAGWANLLTKSSKLALFGPAPDDFETAKQDIDKQFWQNVNTVNVSGGGSTNYVLAKDDVGNWYLKAYEADSEAVFRSAKNLLLFNTGRSINLDLLQRAELQRRANSATDPSERTRLEGEVSKMTAGRSGAAGTGALQSVKGRYEKDYAARTVQDATELRDRLKDAGNQIKVAWDGQLQSKSKSALISSLSATYLPDGPQEAVQARANIEKTLTEGTAETRTPTTTDAMSDAIIDALRMMQRSRMRLYLDIARNDSVLSDLVTGAKAKKDAYEKAISARKDAKAALDKSTEPADRERKAADLKTREGEEAETQKAYTDAEGEYNNARSDRLIAARVAATVIGNVIAPAVARRMDTVRQYETAISFVGEVAGAK